MFRYVAVTWNAEDPSQENAARLLISRWNARAEWREVLTADGLRVLCTGESHEHAQVHTLQSPHGVILGTLFKRGGAEEGDLRVHGALDRSASARIVATDGRELIDSYWGSYVAIVHRAHANKTSIMRGPFSSLPCLRMEFRGLRIYFSYLPDCASCGLLSFTINWAFLAKHLSKIRETGETGLNEVSEVRCGERVESTESGIRRELCWDMLDEARKENIRDPASAISAVRNTVRTCVQAWASGHRHIVHRLSGGLDSAVVLSCLRDAPSQPQLTCLNRYSPRADGDERAFARVVAKHAGCTLVEMLRDAEFRLEDILDAQIAEKPVNYLAQISQALPEVHFARASGATAIFNGDYGDQLFYATQFALTAADYVHDHGIRPGLFPVIVSAARAGNLSFWKVLRDSLSNGLFRRPWDPLVAGRFSNVLINEGAVRDLIGRGTSGLAWYDAERYVPLGRQVQIASIADPGTCYLPFREPDDPQYISPLLSQPLVELCLRIPTYVLCSSGWDREIERRAFASDIPASTARRRSKGTQVEFTSEIGKRNHEFIREVLLNGGLVSHGLLDRAKLEEALAGRSTGLTKGMARMSKLLNIEVWLKSWTYQGLRAAA